MNVGGPWNQNNDKVLLMIFLVVACDHDLPNVSVELFLKLQWSSLDGMMKLIGVFVKQFINCWTQAVRISACCFQQVLFIWQGGSEVVAAVAFHFSPSWESDCWDLQVAFGNWCDECIFGRRTMHFVRT